MTQLFEKSLLSKATPNDIIARLMENGDREKMTIHLFLSGKLNETNKIFGLQSTYPKHWNKFVLFFSTHPF